MSEVQRCRQVRGPAGAVKCETRGLGGRSGTPLIFEEKLEVDTRGVSAG